jgi:hypothetical protein
MWRRSTRCETGACAEVAYFGGEVLLRNSRDPEGPVVRLTPVEWSAFAAGVKAGEFDGMGSVDNDR